MSRTGLGGNETEHFFGHWCLDAATGDLDDGRTTIRLEPQVAKLLVYFLTHQGRLIRRDDLIEEVWEGRIVSDHAINRCISILRGRLTPQDRNAYIETVVRRGFVSHFPAPATSGTPASRSSRQPQAEEPGPVQEARPVFVERRGGAPDRRHRDAASTRVSVFQWRVAALLSFLVLAAVLLFQQLGEREQRVMRSAGEPAPMLAILPFVSHDASEESAFFASGMHDDLLTRLARFESLRVISRTSVEAYRGSTANIREIGRALDADAILEGGVQRDGDRIRINVQLIDARNDVHLWAEQYERDLVPADLFEVQAEIARSIASTLHSALTLRDAGELEVIPTHSMAAYRAYHEAMELRDSRTIASPEYVAELERAVSLDPGYVRAWAELAGSLSYASIRTRDPAVMRRLEAILDRIGQLAPRSSEELIAQSYYTYYILRDDRRALALIEQALALSPNDPQVLELKSWIQRRVGDFEGIVDTLRRARTLDPLNDHWSQRLVLAFFMLHRYDEALREIEAAPVRTFGLAIVGSFLTAREHRDPSRLLEEISRAEREYDQTVTPLERWEALIAARDFAGASAFLETLEQRQQISREWGDLSLPDSRLALVLTNWFLHGVEQSRGLAAAARRQLMEAGPSAYQGFEGNYYLELALVTAAAGDGSEAERLVRTWFREAPRDRAELVNQRHYACRALGMAGAAAAALQCLREGSRVPSLVIPQLEPLWPYYDPVRAQPEFSGYLRQQTAVDT